ncbi:MAG: MBOAT family protein [Anaerovoracaceae bacterium]
MVFSSTVFLFVFLPIVLGTYCLCPTPCRNLLLLVASLVFYGWGEPQYIVVMIFSILFNYASGVIIDKFKSRDKHKFSRLMLIVSVVGNIGILGYFKYTDFILENINNAFATSFGMIELALPIGISFYTFQTMSYVIDVYRGQVKVQKNIINFGTYVTLFPQLIAGPIVRYITIEEQLNHRGRDFDQIANGVRRFIIGLGKKVLLANQIGALWDQINIIPTADLPMATAWLGALAFTFQIYFDFSGYSDMAIGLGKILGFEFDENFNYPYMSKSITEFWRRWHISLSTWFKEYVYVPLGGNRKGTARQIFNIFIVWGLTGLWHGASWNFLLWGLYFGVILIIEKVFLLKKLEEAPEVISRAYALVLIVLGWVIFAITDMGRMGGYFMALVNVGNIVDNQSLYLIITNLAVLIILIFASTDIPKKVAMSIMSRLEEKPVLYIIIKNVFYLAILIISISFLVSDTYNPFLYFRF